MLRLGEARRGRVRDAPVAARWEPGTQSDPVEGSRGPVEGREAPETGVVCDSVFL